MFDVALAGAQMYLGRMLSRALNAANTLSLNIAEDAGRRCTSTFVSTLGQSRGRDPGEECLGFAPSSRVL